MPTDATTDTILIFLPLLLQLSGLTIAVCIDSYISRKHRTIMLIVIAAVAALIGQNYLEYRLVTGTPHIALRTWTAIAGYCIRPVILVLILHIVCPRLRHTAAWALAGVNAAVHLTAVFSDICFTITEDNNYVGGPLRHFCLFVSVLLLGYMLYMTVSNYKEGRKREIWIPLIFVALIGAGIVMDGNAIKEEQPVEYLTVVAVSGCVFYYIWLHLQFVREHRRALEAEQRIQIMMTQIQPHFLYNTLSTIQSLCHIDPEKAYDITGKFGTYLRQNLDALEKTDLIPLKKELEHTRIYADIETTRFPNIQVIYDIRDEDFSLPALTIQPLVENAIRHGVRIRKEGVVKVTTRRTDTAHEIVIEDNGKGFDAAALESALRQEAGSRSEAGARQHIGLKSVRERIGQMCGGTMTIDSRVGEGTAITLRIPLSAAEAGVKEENP